MRKFTYSRTRGPETFSAVEFDSFDEAKRAVDKAIHERELEDRPEKPKASGTGSPAPVAAAKEPSGSTSGNTA